MDETAKTTAENAREPFLRIAKRDGLPLWRAWGVRILAVILALLVNAAFIYSVTGLDPLAVYKVMWDGSFKSFYSFITTMRDTVMLLCIGVALAPAFKMRFWNIGAEGQVLMGGLATAVVMIYLGNSLPNGLLILVMFAAAVIAGAFWAFIPAVFKARWNTNETLFTLMMNYVAINIVDCLTNLWRGAKSSMGNINAVTQAGWFPKILGYRFTLNILIVLALAAAMYLYLRYTKHGYEIAVIGESESTAKYVGINVKKAIIRTMLLSGAICGIAGFITVAGKNMTISSDTAGGYGFTAIIVAWLAKFNTGYMALISFLLIFLEKGATQIASAYAVLNDYASSVVTGVILFFILGSEFFVNYRVIFRKKSRKGGEKA
ncbi:MAG TPA: ABC transporter permease [Oscillospiraceae bacterium]|mgnify:FL=1|nr:ABC transporter permease [Oscillospiraceae bacterium]HPS75635.1 ABC transporter permease [Oscillospiraceae bacterium]